MRTTSLRAIAVLTLLLGASACSGTPSRTGGDAFWTALRINGDEVEGYADLQAMTEGATLVVAGRFVDFKFSRALQGDAPQDIIGYGVATMKIDEVLAGTSTAQSLPVEFLLGGAGTADVASMELATDELARIMPTGPIVAFLHAKDGRTERGMYRLVNSRGLWIQTESGLGAPLAEPDFVPYSAELSNVKTLEGFASLIKSFS